MSPRRIRTSVEIETTSRSQIKGRKVSVSLSLANHDGSLPSRGQESRRDRNWSENPVQLLTDREPTHNPRWTRIRSPQAQEQVGVASLIFLCLAGWPSRGRAPLRGPPRPGSTVDGLPPSRRRSGGRDRATT